MKFYSEITKKLYDTPEALGAAEKQAKDVADERNKMLLEIKGLNEQLNKLDKEYDKVSAKLSAARKEYVAKYKNKIEDESKPIVKSFNFDNEEEAKSFYNLLKEFLY